MKICLTLISLPFKRKIAIFAILSKIITSLTIKIKAIFLRTLKSTLKLLKTFLIKKLIKFMMTKTTQKSLMQI